MAIARALIKKPKIMLFDEATSALDNISEKKVQEAINKLEGITIMVIAHRLSTINTANKIIVLRDGKLEEQGNHEQLLSLNGIYQNLYRLQTCQDANEESANLTKKAIFTKSKLDCENEKNAETVTAVAKTQKEIEEENKWKEENKDRFMSKMWKDNSEHKLSLFFGVILSIISGCRVPVAGFLFGAMIMDLLEPDPDTLRSKINLDFIEYVILALSVLVAFFCEHALFGFISTKVTHKLRRDLYDHILTMDVGWHDLPQNQPYVLNLILSEGTHLLMDL